MTSRRRHFAERRAARGYSQEEFAEVLSVAASTVVRWESGRATRVLINGRRSQGCWE
ncbi:helix-turn-helix transcriptional regulator [Streptomyces roseicoloratus]|uniref:Helix-turn-helix transcriptional regulator n=1 Tax=Streptomyces roseicoloratus TaxID=2508722 RepID=A0ABY9S1M8_9ACTN|nr:helix-turn-helix transcriptional regulator [Streptomyces roseicoloratus]WMX47354.1 helix-turn-helix transcriptional regulator [Streptomyces roseicoloratus]